MNEKKDILTKQAIVQFPARFLLLHNALRLHGVGVGYGFDALQLFLSRQNIIQRNALVTVHPEPLLSGNR